MRVEILVKASIVPSPSFGFFGENVRQFLVRQSPHLKVVKVVLGPNIGGANQTFLAMFRVEFNTGGCLIVETKGDSPSLAFSAGLLRVRRGLDLEMRSRWLSIEANPIPKALKARGPRIGRRISNPNPDYLRIIRLSNAKKGEILALPPP